MVKLLKRLISIVGSLICIALVILLYYKTRTPAPEGKVAPAIEAQLIDGNDFMLEDLRGHYVLLDFWGTWCPPCRKDNPNLVAIYRQFHNKTFKDAAGFEIVSVALEKTDKYWRKTILKDSLAWPYHILKESRVVLTDPLARAYGVTDLPTKFLINPQGKIVGTNLTRQQIEEYLRARL